MSQVNLSEADLLQSITRESFYEFVREFWDTLIQEEPVWNWHIEYLCDELQVVAERVIAGKAKEYDLIINIPPGTTKSTICSQMFPSWVWTKMAWARFIAASYEHNLALNFARRSRDIVESEKYQAAYKFKKVDDLIIPVSPMDQEGESMALKDDQNAKGHYENIFTGDRKSVGAGGNITGSHGHFILVDDPINPKEAVSEAGLKNVNRWMSETLPSRKVDKAVTPTILIMQRLHQDDPTGHLLAKGRGNIKHICLPCDTSYDIKPARLKLKYVKPEGEEHGLLDPVRLSRAVLDEQRADLGEYGYAGQYGQSPVPLGGGMFKIDKINIDIPPLPIEFVVIVRYWDKAGTKNAGAHTAGVLMGIDQLKRFWVLDVVRGQWDSGTRERIIKQTAQNDAQHYEGKVIVGLEQEGGSGGKESAENTVINLRGYTVRVDRPVGDKVTRADPYSVQVNIGNVYVPKGAEWWDAYRSELQFFPFSKYKDQVDASSGAFALVNNPQPHRGAL